MTTQHSPGPVRDLFTAFGRVLTQNRPTGEGLRSFVFDEIVGTAIGWSAGSLSTWLIQQYFVKKSIWNLGGLAADRVALSGEEYTWASWAISYGVGLGVVILVRTLIIGTLRELSAMRSERR